MKPKLNKSISLKDFQAYYWLKKELIDFCRDNKIATAGGKQEISERIENFLKTGEIIAPARSPQKVHNKSQTLPITLDSRLADTYKNNAENRKFFKSVIGERFKFNVVHMKWVKENSEKTYQDAVNEWFKIEKDKKAGKKQKISPQFEYNQYTRDFFEANPNKKRSDAIKCWKYKKSIPGSNKYEESDLEAIK